MTKGPISKWTISYVESAMKDIASLDGSTKKIIKKVIEEKLMIDPLKFGHPLKRSLAGLFKLRVGDYRIIYQIRKQEVLVVVIKVQSLAK
ncbi:MAG TPA: type II toxin-antitoxin system RelE/ParE family toxin [Bacteriovoracaceae bacterium]|nr:type II toxin-antitoxin system RelE/ParE family toxin [Bacteriovoracaceae bacterium]